MAKNTEKLNAMDLFQNMRTVNTPSNNDQYLKEDKSVYAIEDKESFDLSSDQAAGYDGLISTATIELFSQKKKERKVVHKSFTTTERLNNKFSALARKTNMSENELFNKILEQILGV